MLNWIFSHFDPDEIVQNPFSSQMNIGKITLCTFPCLSFKHTHIHTHTHTHATQFSNLSHTYFSQLTNHRHNHLDLIDSTTNGDYSKSEIHVQSDVHINKLTTLQVSPQGYFFIDAKSKRTYYERKSAVQS